LRDQRIKFAVDRSSTILKKIGRLDLTFHFIGYQPHFTPFYPPLSKCFHFSHDENDSVRWGFGSDASLLSTYLNSLFKKAGMFRRF
jgi:hypothetical protein